MKINYIVFNDIMFKYNENIKIYLHYNYDEKIKKYIETNKYNENILYLDIFLKDININKYNENNFEILKFNKYNELLKDKISYKFNNFLIIDLFNLNEIQYFNNRKCNFYLLHKILYENIYNNKIETNF